MPFEIAAGYRSASDSLIEFYESLGADDWAKPVPCTPLWTVRDVLSHTAGLADDVVNGRMEGAGTDPWTASQVERYADDDPSVLIARWKEQIDGVGAGMEAMGEGRPVFDTHSHEHDLRHALGRPGNRDSELAVACGTLMSQALAGQASVTVELASGARFGEDGPSVAGLTPFEMFRSRLGRRSRQQVLDYAWTGEPDAVSAVVDTWFVFGPTELPIIE